MAATLPLGWSYAQVASSADEETPRASGGSAASEESERPSSGSSWPLISWRAWHPRGLAVSSSQASALPTTKCHPNLLVSFLALAASIAVATLWLRGSGLMWQGTAAGGGKPTTATHAFDQRGGPGEAVAYASGGGVEGGRQSRGVREVEVAMKYDCGRVEQGVDYWTEASLYQIYPITHAKECRDQCEQEARCGAWTWGKARGVIGLSDICFLKAVGEGEQPEQRANARLVSGLACRHSGSGAGARPGEGGGSRAAAAAANAKASRHDGDGDNGRRRSSRYDGSGGGGGAEGPEGCGGIKDGVDYWTSAPLYKISPVMTAEECQQKCQVADACRVWTWGKPGGGISMDAACFLKDVRPDEQPKRHSNPGVMSGVACLEKGQRSKVHIAETTTARPLTADELAHQREVDKRPKYLCGLAEDDVEYLSGEELVQLSHILDADLCQRYCEGNQRCLAWSWSIPPEASVITDGADGTCRLLATPNPDKVQRPGFISGLVCHRHDGSGGGRAADGAAAAMDSAAAKISSAASAAVVANSGRSHAPSAAAAAAAADAAEAALPGSAAAPSVATSSTTTTGLRSKTTTTTSATATTAATTTAAAKASRTSRPSSRKQGKRDKDERGHGAGAKRHRGGEEEVEEDEGKGGEGGRHTKGGGSSKKTHSAAARGKAEEEEEEREEGKKEEKKEDGRKRKARAATTTTVAATTTTPAPVGSRLCDLLEREVDFQTEASLYNTPSVTSADACSKICTKEPKCGAWSWGEKRNADGLTDVCFLKVLPEDEEPDRKPKTGVISGLPCRGEGLGPQPPMSTTTPFPDAFPPGSLYCFELMQPSGYEPRLIKMQYEQGTSIFACEEYAVYSNQVISIADGLMSRPVESDLKCTYGGEFKTALNTQIFFAVWNKVVEEGRFRHHDWVAKVDPDCVFLPDRLRGLLAQHAPSDPKGVYLNNCRMGLHGPLEIFSRSAIEAWQAGREQCVTHFTRLCSGDCFWGEDMFIDQCLWKVLKVRRDDDWNLLVEDHCDPPDGWESCQDRSKVAFHPFKTEEGFQNCMVGTGASSPSKVELA